MRSGIGCLLIIWFVPVFGLLIYGAVVFSGAEDGDLAAGFLGLSAFAGSAVWFVLFGLITWLMGRRPEPPDQPILEEIPEDDL